MGSQATRWVWARPFGCRPSFSWSDLWWQSSTHKIIDFNDHRKTRKIFIYNRWIGTGRFHMFFKQISFGNLIIWYLICVKICPKGVSKKLTTMVQTIVSPTFEKLNILSNNKDTVEVVVFSHRYSECVSALTTFVLVSM
jgi:hypothetical protein